MAINFADTPVCVAGVRRQLRPKQVAALLGVSKTTVWNWVKQGKLPRPVKISPTATIFYADEIAEWQKLHLQPEA